MLMMQGTHSRSLFSYRRLGALGALGALALFLAGRPATAVEPPVAPPTSSGSYSVTYQRCSGCFMDWLEERVGEAGSWNTAGAIGSGTTAFTNKAEGRYYYRAAYMYMAADYSYYMDYSAPVTVLVGGNLPTINPLEVQLTYRYEARQGDIDGNGRQDFYVARTSGGAPGDGTIDTVLLRQASDGRFTASVPTAAELLKARAWAASSARILLKDVNADGFADVVLGRVSAALGVSGVRNQVVYAPGEPLRYAPRGVRAVDSAFTQFVVDTSNYVRDPAYFVSNATWITYVYTYYEVICQPAYGLDYPTYSSYLQCYWYPVTTVTVTSDYSAFSRAAVDIWTYESQIESGQIAAKDGIDRIEGVLESVAGVDVGGWSRREVIDAAHPIRAAEYLRGLELFTAFLRMKEAGAAEPEQAGAAGRTADIVYITGRRIMGIRAIHTALEYRGSTISAYDSIDGTFDDGLLISEVDWARDRPLLMMTLGTVTGPVTPSLYWARLLAADRRYADKLPYDAIPSLGRAGYNSNGYSHGIVLATSGVPSIAMTRFIGGEKPVPASAF
jgi:hypothetical protein